MRTRILGLTMAAAFAISAFGGTALATSDNHQAPGTPGDPNCTGQTMAWLAQLGQSAGVQEASGIGGLAAFFGVSVKELKAAVASICEAP